MRILKFLTITILLFNLSTVFACAQTKKKPKQKAETPANEPLKNPQTKMEDFKILTGNAMGNVEEPLIYVARDAVTYERLKKVVPELPAKEQIDFKNHAVVGAFLGTVPTAGIEVKLGKTATGAIKIEKKDVPRGGMVAQVLTTPFSVALVPVDEEGELKLEIGAHWKNAMQTFRVGSGEFVFSGGFAPIEKKFGLGGTIGWWRVGDLITVDFNVVGKGSETRRQMDEIASGFVEGEEITLNRIEPGGLIDPPHPALKASGVLKANSLSLVFQSLPTNYSDGYQGEGKLTAAK